MSKQQIGVIGLAVMGKNLALNIESKGFSVSVFNRSPEKTQDLVAEAAGKNLVGTFSVEEFVQSLEVPRKILIMVQAGKATDATIEQLLPYLDQGDIIIDGGNAYFPDTVRRSKYLEDKGFRFVGTGVSGGEEGALKGPSIMPGGQARISWLNLSLRRFQPTWAESLAVHISGRTVQDTMSKWCITASSTVTCS